MKQLLIIASSFFMAIILIGCFDVSPQKKEFQFIENPYLSGDGTKDSPYLIGSSMDFYNIRYSPSAHYLLTQSIDFNSDVFIIEDGIVVQGITMIETPFYGTLNGGGYTLKLSSASPMFPALKNATVQNLVIDFSTADESVIDSYRYYNKLYECNGKADCDGFYGEELIITKNFGFISLTADSKSQIENIVIKGSFSKVFNNRKARESAPNISYSGMLVGENYGSIKNIMIDGSFAFTLNNVQGAINAHFAYYHIGLVTGYNEGKIENIVANGSMNITAHGRTFYVTAGGIVGTNESMVSNAWVHLDIDLTNYSQSGISRDGSSAHGGIIGENTSRGTAKNVIFKGLLKNKSGRMAAIGGIAGSNSGMIQYGFSEVEFDVYRNWTDVSNQKSFGGIIGHGSMNSIDRVYYIKKDDSDNTRTFGHEISDNNEFKLEKNQIEQLFMIGMMSLSNFEYSTSLESAVINLDSTYWQSDKLKIDQEG
jgi:hypothetical protein